MTKRQDDKYIEASVEELLTEDAAQEIAQREGEWNAFTSAVFARIDEEDLGVARMPMEDQAIDLFRQEVAGELADLAPRFEEGFKEGVEQRIWNAAREPTVMDRVRGFFDRAFGERVGWSVGWAGAMAAALAIVTITGMPTEPGTQIAENITGEVSVKSLSFEGTVTVMPNDGVTVVWLSDDASS
ncbi:MAG: hypothetical protein RMA76_42420 [Deltaproteobacteria bacterium]